jgi:hypothetical protein
MAKELFVTDKKAKKASQMLMALGNPELGK